MWLFSSNRHNWQLRSCWCLCPLMQLPVSPSPPNGNKKRLRGCSPVWDRGRWMSHLLFSRFFFPIFESYSRKSPFVLTLRRAQEGAEPQFHAILLLPRLRHTETGVTFTPSRQTSFTKSKAQLCFSFASSYCYCFIKYYSPVS